MKQNIDPRSLRLEKEEALSFDDARLQLQRGTPPLLDFRGALVGSLKNKRNQNN